MKQNKLFEITVLTLVFLGIIAVSVGVGILIIAFCDYIKALAGTTASLVAFFAIVVLALVLFIGFFGRRAER